MAIRFITLIRLFPLFTRLPHHACATKRSKSGANSPLSFIWSQPSARHEGICAAPGADAPNDGFSTYTTGQRLTCRQQLSCRLHILF